MSFSSEGAAGYIVGSRIESLPPYVWRPRGDGIHALVAFDRGYAHGRLVALTTDRDVAGDDNVARWVFRMVSETRPQHPPLFEPASWCALTDERRERVIDHLHNAEPL